MKLCRKCEIEKDETEFWRHKKASDGLQSYCKVCNSAAARAYAVANPEITRTNVRKGWEKHQYNLTPEESARLSDHCDICGGTKRLGVDHDHETGAVRGRLCNRCNNWIARLNDDVAWLASAIKYLSSPPFGEG